MSYEQQLELLLNKPRESTPEEFDHWQKTELNWWAEKQFPIIWIAVAVQLSALGFMFGMMKINSVIFS